jgi:hypothetical protein
MSTTVHIESEVMADYYASHQPKTTHAHCYTYAESDTPASNAPHTRTECLDPSKIRQIYRYAEYWDDNGRKVSSSGYGPEDQIGHAVISTVQGLCDEVTRLRLALGRAERIIVSLVRDNTTDPIDGTHDEILSYIYNLYGDARE